MRLRKIRSFILLASFAAALLLLQRCGSQHDPPKKILHYKRERLYTIRVPGSGNFIQKQFQPKGSENVYFINYDNSEFYILDAAHGKLRRSCILPDDIYESDAFTVDEKAKRINVFFPDSINIYTYDGAFVKTIQLFEPKGGFVYMGGQSFPAIHKNGKWYLTYLAEVDNEFKNPTLFKAPVEAEIDLKTAKARLLVQGYPSIYQQYSYGYDYDPGRIEIDENTHGYFFPHSDSIYICNIHTGQQSVRFFGVKTPKKFKHIPFAGMESLNESVFSDLLHINPSYTSAIYAPLAGYYVRQLVSPPAKEGGKYIQRFAFFDRGLNYIGESPVNANFLIDSKRGLLSLRVDDHYLIIDKFSW